MARAIWKGSISFGLVNIPVELHTAVRNSRPRFRLLHKTDKSPIEYQRVCRREGKPVEWSDVVKGFEHEKGRYVVLTKDDFDAAALQKSRAIEILDFVDLPAIDPRFFDAPYYVLPAGGSERAYAVLREALRERGKVGVGRVLLREVQHLAAVGAVGDALTLTMMRFADELVDTSSFRFPSSAGMGSRELQLARMLIDNLSSEWNPQRYKDQYRENLMKVIRAKLKGQRVKLEDGETPKSAEVIDLMTRLRDSLERGQSAKNATRTKPPTKAVSSRARKKRPAKTKRGKAA